MGFLHRGNRRWLGVGRAGYRAHRALRLNTYAYIEQRMKEVDKRIGYHPSVPLLNEFVTHFETFIDYSAQLLNKNHIAGGKFYQLDSYILASPKVKINGETQVLPPEDHKRKYIDISKKMDADSFDDDFIRLYVHQEQTWDKFQPNAFIKFVNKISSSKPANVLSYIWNWASNHAFLFWIVWMPFALAAGTAAAFALPFLPIIVGITLGVGAIFTIFKVIEMALAARKERKAIEKINAVLNATERDEDDKFATMVLQIKAKTIKLKHIAHLDATLKAQLAAHTDLNTDKMIKIDSLEQRLKVKVIAKIMKDLDALEKTRVTHLHAELRQRAFMKYEHTAIMSQIKHTYDWKQDQERGFKKRYQQAFNDFINKDDVKKQRAVNEMIDASLLKLTNHMRANSGGERHARLVIGVINSTIAGFIMPLFVLWLASSIVMVPVLLGVVALAGVASLLGSSMLYTVGGALLSTVFGIQTTAQRRQAQLAFDERMNNKFLERYKNEVIGKGTKFCQLESAVNEKIAGIRQHNPVLMATLKAKGFDINKIDAYNDYYFEKQKAQPSGWTLLKKTVNRVYQFLGGGQTGALITRCLGLAGCIFAPAIAALPFGGPIAFVAVAIIMAVIVGSLRVAQYQLEANQKHREFFADTIDARISYLKKKDKELTAILDSQPKVVVPANAPILDALVNAPLLGAPAKAPILIAEESSEEESVAMLDASAVSAPVVVTAAPVQPAVQPAVPPAVPPLHASANPGFFRELTSSYRDSSSSAEVDALNAPKNATPGSSI